MACNRLFGRKGEEVQDPQRRTFASFAHLQYDDDFSPLRRVADISTGDYFFAGHLDEPTVKQMGEIVFKIKSGGVDGLRDMGFLPELVARGRERPKFELGTIQHAFEQYYRWTCQGGGMERGTPLSLSFSVDV